MRLPFTSPFKTGTIISRPNRFLMNVSLDGVSCLAHCPTTGGIGNIDFSIGCIPCLVSESDDIKRKTKYTVEAISLQPMGTENNNEWVGINQSKANTYIKHFLKHHQLSDMISGEVKSEVTVGKSRLDFQVSRSFMEVKTPLIHLETPQHLQNKKVIKKTKGTFTRLIKHFNELGDTLNISSGGNNFKSKTKRKAIVALAYMYDAKPFVPPDLNKNNNDIIEAAARARDLGVETWQINMGIDRDGVTLIKYFRIT